MADAPQPQRPKPLLKRCLRRLAQGVAALFLLMALGTWVENWRGERAWQQYQTERAEAGDPVQGLEYFSPTIPSEQNFAMAAPLAPLVQRTLNPETLSLDLTDPKAAQAQLDRIPKLYVQYALHGGRPRLNRFCNLGAAASSVIVHGDRRVPDPSQDRTLNWESRQQAAQAMLDWFESFKAMDELVAALERPQGRFILQYDGLTGSVESSSPVHHTIMPDLSSAFYFRALCHLYTGNRRAALDDLKVLLRISHAFNEDHLTKSHLISIMIFETAAAALWEGLVIANFTEDELEIIQQEFTAFNWLNTLQQAFQGDLALANVLCQSIIDDPDNSFRRRIFLRGKSRWHQLRLAMPDGWVRINQIKIHQLYRNHVFPNFDPNKQLVFPKTTEANNKRIRSWVEGGWGSFHFYTDLVTRFRAAGPETYVHQTARVAVLVKIIGTICALKRYKMKHPQYPTTLRELIPEFLLMVPSDFTVQRPLKYQLFPEGYFMIWSVGWNQSNEKGNSMLDWAWYLPVNDH